MQNGKKILFFPDNLFIVNSFKELIKDLKIEVDLRCSPVSPLLVSCFEPISIKLDNYVAKHSKTERNINLKKDFNALCEIDLQPQQSGYSVGYIIE